MNITALNSYSRLPITSTTSAPSIETSKKTKCTADDRVSISPEAAKLWMQTSFMDGAGEDGVITMEEIKAFRDKQIKQVETILQDTLKDLGINSSDPLEIDIDPFNNIIITGGKDTENKALAAALQDNSEFINAYNGAGGASTLLSAAAAGESFRNAYSDNPTAAVARYGWLFDKEWDFNISYENGKVDYCVS